MTTLGQRIGKGPPVGKQRPALSRMISTIDATNRVIARLSPQPLNNGARRETYE